MASKSKETNTKETKEKKETNDKTTGLDGKEKDGVIYYTGSGLNKTVTDKAGKTITQISGEKNNITFNGDDGANTFKIDGKSNNIDINNIGDDEKVYLEGNAKDWKIVDSTRNPDNVLFADRNEKHIVYENTKTGTRVEVSTDHYVNSVDGKAEQYISKRTVFSDGSDTQGLYNKYKLKKDFTY